MTDNSRTEQVKLYAIAGSAAVNTFAEGDPKVTIELTVDHPNAKGFFRPGKLYTVTFSPVETADSGIKS